MKTSKSLLTKSERALLRYLEKDYILLPVDENKRPLVKNWNTYQANYYREKRSITKLLTVYGRYALRTGKLVGRGYYFVVLDLDDFWALTRLQEKRYVQTKQGVHLYLLLGELPKSCWVVNRQEEKIGELHSQGRYVVGIGSWHKEKVRYTLHGKNNLRYFVKLATLCELEKYLAKKGIFLRPWNWKKSAKIVS